MHVLLNILYLVLAENNNKKKKNMSDDEAASKTDPKVRKGEFRHLKIVTQL